MGQCRNNKGIPHGEKKIRLDFSIFHRNLDFLEKRRRKDISRTPTPYEVVRDYLQIASSVLLSFAIVVLTMMNVIEFKGWTKDYLQPAIILGLLIILVVVIIDVLRFRKNWVSWVRKK
ncbi:MAG TPA: hypothetical protein VJ343_00270 [archaeon]|nr:hypothetical protein [archaeon]